MVNILKTIQDLDSVKFIPVNSAINMDCLIALNKVKDKSVNVVLADLPYGTLDSEWDIIIPMEDYINVTIKNKIKRMTFTEFLMYSLELGKSYIDIKTEFNNSHIKGLWYHYERIITDTGVIVLTASHPFTNYLINSNLKLFKYELIWEKSVAFGFVHSKNQPLKKHENILIFSKAPMGHQSLLGDKRMTYNPVGAKNNGKAVVGKKPEQIGLRPNQDGKEYMSMTGFPNSILSFDNELSGLHPTKKPVKLFEYLIKMYSNENDVILDNTAGVLTTACASINTNRNFIVMEMNEDYFNKGINEIQKLNRVKDVGFIW